MRRVLFIVRHAHYSWDSLKSDTEALFQSRFGGRDIALEADSKVKGSDGTQATISDHFESMLQHVKDFSEK